MNEAGIWLVDRILIKMNEEAMIGKLKMNKCAKFGVVIIL